MSDAQQSKDSGVSGGLHPPPSLLICRVLIKIILCVTAREEGGGGYVRGGDVCDHHGNTQKLPASYQARCPCHCSVCNTTKQNEKVDM